MSDTEFEVIITAPKDLPAGKHPLKLFGYGEFQGVGTEVSSWEWHLWFRRYNHFLRTVGLSA